MEETQSIGGYSTTIFVDPPPANLICGVCIEVFKNPHQCKNGHVFCLSCITESLESKQECPECRTHLKVERLASCLFIRNMVGQLLTKCQIANCPWTGILDSREEHIKVCQFETITCPLYKHGACGKQCWGTVLRAEKTVHVQNEIQCSSEKIIERLLNKIEAQSSELDMLREYMPVGKHRNGQGSASSFTGVSKDGDEVACGTFVNNKLNGYCTDVWKGGTYRGNMLNDCVDGKGRFEYANGDFHEGEFKNDMRHGFGVCYCKQFKYEGEWKNDKIHGTGTMYWKDGSVYVGKFDNSQYDGQGTLTMANGESISGFFIENEKPL